MAVVLSFLDIVQHFRVVRTCRAFERASCRGLSFVPALVYPSWKWPLAVGLPHLARCRARPLSFSVWSSSEPGADVSLVDFVTAGCLSRATSWTLGGSAIRDNVIAALHHASAVRTLRFDGIAADPAAALAAAATMAALTALDLHSAGAVAAADADIGCLVAARVPLQSLTLSTCRGLTDLACAFLALLPLVRLCLGHVPFTDAGFALLSGLPLQSLELRQTQRLTSAGLAFVSAMPLRCLQLSAAPARGGSGRLCIDGTALVHLRYLVHLETLVFVGIPIATVAPLRCLTHLPLREINLRGGGVERWDAEALFPTAELAL